MSIELIPIPGIPEVEDGADLAELISGGSPAIDGGDILCVAQKIVSKAEGRIRNLLEVEPGERAVSMARKTGKDPRLVELILAESRSVIRSAPGVLIVETSSGWICANAGIDQSNVPGAGRVALLPVDADASARRIRASLRERTGHAPAVLITDSFGRPWRLGQSDVAIGCAGIDALQDWRGRQDRDGFELQAAMPATADQLAAAAELTRDKAGGTPIVVVRGLAGLVTETDGPGATGLQRPRQDDLFRG